jgi:uncharacterized lipoprotein YmbA
MIALTSRYGAFIVLCGLLAGCTGGLPTTHYYVLRPPAEAQAAVRVATAEHGLVVGVEAFAVDPPYDQDRIVYRRGQDSSEVGFYAYHRWASPLGRLVSVALAERFRGTPGIDAIEPATSSGDYSARLRGRVLYVEEVDSEDGQQARVGLDLELWHRDGQALWAQTVSGTASGRAESGDEVVLLLRQAFDHALDTARQDLATALKP